LCKYQYFKGCGDGTHTSQASLYWHGCFPFNLHWFCNDLQEIVSFTSIKFISNHDIEIKSEVFVRLKFAQSNSIDEEFQKNFNEWIWTLYHDNMLYYNLKFLLNSRY